MTRLKLILLVLLLALAGCQTSPAARPTARPVPAALPTLPQAFIQTQTAAAQAPVSTATPLPDASGLQTLQDPLQLYTVQYPDGWQASTSATLQKLCATADPNICLTITLYPGIASLTALADTWRAWAGAQVQQLVLAAPEDTELGVYPAQSFAASFTRNGQPQQGFVLFSQHHRLGVSIWVEAPQAVFEEQRPDLEGIAYGLTLNDPGDLPPYADWQTLKQGSLQLYAVADSPAAEQLPEIAASYQNARQAIQKALGISDNAPIHVYLYPSTAALAGAGGYGGRFALPAAAEVHDLWAGPEETTPPGHGLASVLIQRAWGAPGTALLSEGLAGCLDQSGVDPRQAARDLQQAGRLLPLAALSGVGWQQQPPEVAQPQAASLACYLLEKHGPAVTRQLYQAGDLPAALQATLGSDLAGLERDWLAWLR